MIEIGKTYKDGWGVDQTIAGVTKVSPDWVWSVQGNWYRQADGRFIAYKLVDQSRPDGVRRHVPADRETNWDLKVE